LTGPHPGWIVAALGTAQTLSWASSYYLVAILAAPMARDVGVAAPTVFAAFSGAMIVSALLAPRAGRIIDRHGGRTMLMVSNVLFALGLAALGVAQNAVMLFAAWALMGLAMGSGLYDAAFAMLVHRYGPNARNSITGVTLIAGFASTVGWPLTAWLEAEVGWRGACFVWAGLQLALGLPLNAWLPRTVAARPPAVAAGAGEGAAGEGAAGDGASDAAPAGASAVGDASAGHASRGAASAAKEEAAANRSEPAVLTPQRARTTALLLATVFAAAYFVTTSMAAHLPSIVQAAGATLAVAVAVGALVGPSQVAGRLLEFGLLRKVHPLLSARLAMLGHPVGVMLLLLAGPAFAPAFAVLHGAGNGILTIAMATLPLALFGPKGYGARQGWLMMPARFLQALAPFLFGLALERWSASALWLSCGLGLVAFAALMALRMPGGEPVRSVRAI
jgi:MFS family permease